MPYVPSGKTVPPAEDRKILDPLIDDLAEKAASWIKENIDLIPIYSRMFRRVGAVLEQFCAKKFGIVLEEEENLAFAIYNLREKYHYDGAEDGELNYSITRFIQRVPQIKVKHGEWPAKNELRYWLYARTVQALTAASLHFKDSELGLGGVFEDIKDEYKWRVNRAYEAAQILKSGDCYDTPFYTKLMPIRFKDKVRYIDVYCERDEETLGKDVLAWELVAVPVKRAATKRKAKK